jgi:hypothetical protein
MQGTHCGYTLNRTQFASINRHKMDLAALLIPGPAVYSEILFKRDL